METPALPSDHWAPELTDQRGSTRPSSTFQCVPHHGAIKATPGLGGGVATAGVTLGWSCPGTAPRVTPSPPGLLLLTSFLLHVEEGHATPTRLVCDNRLIQKYIGEAKDMEKRVGQCQALPALSCPAVLPLVDFRLQQWKSKSNETKRREILCDLALLVGAVAVAQGQVTQECGARQLNQLHQHASSFLRLLQTFGWEAGPWEPGCSPRSTEQTHVNSIFLTYRQLVQGKLRFFFHDLAKDLCKQGQGGGRDPQCMAC
ncbi:thrombopoietin isoform X2 [Tyto alba]|uniref:thrombopoietin isoform X2 n=1 Tax=Tyto alba TaxID=56313 RepID=UPI001C66B9A7|nr:thrombopoietin isoform X2 [Tyto alba]